MGAYHDGVHFLWRKGECGSLPEPLGQQMDVLGSLSSVHVHALLRTAAAGCRSRLELLGVKMRTRTKHLLEMVERGHHACWCFRVRVGRMRFYANSNISTYYPCHERRRGMVWLTLGSFSVWEPESRLVHMCTSNERAQHGRDGGWSVEGGVSDSCRASALSTASLP